MSRKKKESKPGYGRIMDAWCPPTDAHEPVGCVATTFTFSPVFFEEECLARFVQLVSDPDDIDDPSYLIEREEKLAGLTCAVLVDQNHCRGNRSLRWDMLSARVRGGIQHAKVSLLHWQNWTRLIVASANLTEEGYRRNQEVFGVLDYHAGSEAPLACLQEVLSFLREAAAYAVMPGQEPGPAVTRWAQFLDRVQKDAAGWGNTGEIKPGFSIRPVLILPRQNKSALQMLADEWPDDRPATDACVTSPFFDPPSKQNVPTQELWKILRQRGDASVTFQLVAEPIVGESGLLVHAPESLLAEQPKGRSGVETHFTRLQEYEQSEGDRGELRPIHLKTLWIKNEKWNACMIGSSNFTSPGLGLKPANLEANLLYLVNSQRAPDEFKNLTQGYLQGEDLEVSQILQWQPIPDDADSDLKGAVLLPAAFGEAIYTRDDKLVQKVRFHLGKDLPAGWRVSVPGEAEIILDEALWVAQGKPPSIDVSWQRGIPPSGFEVFWTGSEDKAWWSVTVEHGMVLPPPEQLKDLKLDALINILSSARPLHQVLSAWLKRHTLSAYETEKLQRDLDPHRRVNTASFLLQRTRRVAQAFTALCERLKRPAVTPEILQWKLHGPVGVKAVADALCREAKSEPERCFLLSELCLELSRIQPELPANDGCVAPTVVKEEIKKMIEEIQRDIAIESLKDMPGLKSYVVNAMKESSL